MLRKTISMDESLMLDLQKNGLLEEFKNFSELVNSALQEKMQAYKKVRYKSLIEAASKDPMFLEDIAQISDDFKYVDGENDAF